MKKLALICEAFGRGRGRGRGDGCETMRKLLAAFALTALLTGCVTTQWAHPAFAGKQGAEDEAKIARAQCRAYARGIGPAPVAPTYMPVPAATSYSTTGTYQSYGSTGTFNAITTANPSYASGFASGYNSGAALGASLANAIAAAQTEELADACMRRLGWIDVGTAEGKAALQQRVSETQLNKTQRASETPSNKPQRINYSEAYRTTKLTKIGPLTDNMVMYIGTFNTSSTLAENTAGVIVELRGNKAVTNENGVTYDTTILFGAFNCTARTYALMGGIQMLDKNVVLTNFKDDSLDFKEIDASQDNMMQFACLDQVHK